MSEKKFVKKNPQGLVLLAHPMEIPDYENFINFCKNNNLAHTIIGVGANACICNFPAWLQKNPKPDWVLLLGTAGVLGKGNALLKIYKVNSFCLPPYRFEQYPEIIEKTWTTAIPEILSNALMNSGTAFSGSGISVSMRHLKKTLLINPKKGNLEQSFAILENMEVGPISYICYKEKIPFAAVLCSTNIIGRDGRDQWKKNYREAGRKLSETLFLLAH